MTNKRNLGVTEARLGLSLLTLLLVALGYVVLQRVGNEEPAPPPTAVNSSQTVASFLATTSVPPSGGQNSPVVPVQGIEAVPAAYPHTSQPPQWLAPQQGDNKTSLQRFDPSAPDGNLGEPSLFDPETIRASQLPAATPLY